MSLKLKVGHKLHGIREQKGLNKAQMARLLDMEPSRYGYLENGERYATMEDLTQWAAKLDVPVQDFLPDTISINNMPKINGVGCVFGSYSFVQNYYYGAEGAPLDRLAQENDALRAQVEELKARLARLEGDNGAAENGE